MPDLRPPKGNHRAAARTARGGLFFGGNPTRPQLQEHAEAALSFEEAGYTSAVALAAEIAEIADRFGYDILASKIRRRIAVRLEGSLS